MRISDWSSDVCSSDLTQDAVTASFQIPGSRSVDGFIVLAAVEFHHEAAGRAGEIDDVGADRILAAELVAHQRAVAQVMPDLALGIGHVAAEVAGEFGFVGGAHPCGSGVGVWMSLPARREFVCRGREGLFVGKAGPSPGAARLPLPLRRRGAARSLEARCFSPSPAKRERGCWKPGSALL